MNINGLDCDYIAVSRKTMNELKEENKQLKGLLIDLSNCKTIEEAIIKIKESTK